MKPFDTHLLTSLVLVTCANTSSNRVWWTIFMGLAILIMARAILESMTEGD